MRYFTRWLPLVATVLVSMAASGRAQTPTPQGAAALPKGYAGSNECTTCHRAAATQFAATFKGKLFLQHPRDEREALGCESCHGPAKQHVQTGGEERGGLIVFGKKQPSSVA